MFSIIIPLYNKAPYIEKAIRSVLSQSYQEFELIIIDDGSTDIIKPPNPLKGGFEITYSDIELLLGDKGFIQRQENQGVSTARNNGVALAKYPYIAFLDADDWWSPSYLEEMKALIEEFPDAGIYGSSYFKVKDSKNIPANIGVEKDFERGYINYCQVYAKTLWMPLTSISVVIPKKVFDKEGGFKPNLKLGEDFDMWIRIAMEHKVAFYNKPLAYYNQDVDEISKAVVNEKIFPPKIHYIFNIDYLNELEKHNADLKCLLDKLRVYTLLRYRLQRVYNEEYQREVSKIDFSKVDTVSRLYYTLPIWIVNLYINTKKRVAKLLK